MVDARAVLDGPAVRRWADAGLAALTAARHEIDALNVYPVADSDTGTNLVRTWQACVAEVDGADTSSASVALGVLAGAALRGSCGNSGTIVSQLLRGLADGAGGAAVLDGPAFAAALTHAAGLARTALARPVEGTILTVADAAADAAARSAADGDADVLSVVGAAARAAAEALAATPDQLAALGGRVDAGGRGLVLLLDALELAVSGRAVEPSGASDPLADLLPAALVADSAAGAGAGNGPAYEVMYLLELPPEPPSPRAHRLDLAAGSDPVVGLRAQLAELGDSVVVVGGGTLWQVHAHVDDVGGALEAGLEIGRPHRVRVTSLPQSPPAESRPAPQPPAGPEGLGVVAVVAGAGLAALLTGAGALVVPADRPGPAAAVVHAAVRSCGTPSVALLVAAPAVHVESSVAHGVGGVPADELGVAAELAAGDGIELRILPVRSAVQAIAALAVHDPGRDPSRDFLEMATAAAGTRHGLVERADGDGLTSAGWCHPGDVLGHVGGDVAVIGRTPGEVGAQVVELLLGGGGELVTLVTGALGADDLADAVASGVRSRRPDVEVTSYEGGQPASYLLVGVE